MGNKGSKGGRSMRPPIKSDSRGFKFGQQAATGGRDAGVSAPAAPSYPPQSSTAYPPGAPHQQQHQFQQYQQQYKQQQQQQQQAPPSSSGEEAECEFLGLVPRGRMGAWTDVRVWCCSGPGGGRPGED
jgi:hypothetical protein